MIESTNSPIASSVHRFSPIFRSKNARERAYSPLDGDTYGASPLSISTQAPLNANAKPKPFDTTTPRCKALTLGVVDEIAWHVSIVDAIISHHHGPILSLRLSEPICSHIRVTGTLDRWIKVLDHKGIQNLTFDGNLPSLFSTCHSLCSLKLINGYFLCLDSFPMMPLPPNLRELRLRSTVIRNTSLSFVLSSCRLLNTLVLNICRYFAFGPAIEITHISSPCLRELIIACAFHRNAALSIQEALNLEILTLDEIFTERMPLKVVNAPKLRQLGVVNANVWILEFGHTC